MRLPINQRLFQVVPLLLFIFSSHAVQAKTWYVEDWSSVNTNCGTRSNPCETIQAVLSQAKKNDRIMVGPGSYPGDLLITSNANGPLSGIKLYSTAGRYGTTIFGPGGNTAIYVTQDKVQIGKKGKGFTIFAGAPNARGLSSSTGAANRIKIEGNSFRNIDYAVFITGEKPQIRGNIFMETGRRAISCGNCIKGQIQGNLFTRTELGADADIYLSNADHILVKENRFRFSNAPGVRALSTTQNAVVRDNVSLFHTDSVVQMDNADGAQVQGNIFDRTQDHAIVLDQDTHDKPVKISHNLTMNTFATGIFGIDLIDAQISNNASYFDYDHALELTGVTIPKKLSGNSAIDTESECGLLNDTGVLLQFDRYFTKGLNQAYCGGPADGTYTDKPLLPKVSRAAKL